MFGANAFGWPYFGQAQVATASGITITLADAADLQLLADPATVSSIITPTSGAAQLAADTAILPVIATAGTASLAADAPTVIPLAADSGSAALTADDAATFLVTASSAAALLSSDGAGTFLVQPASAFELLLDAAALANQFPLETGAGPLALAGETVVIYPLQLESDPLVLPAGEPAAVYPILGVSGRLLLAADGVTVFPAGVTVEPLILVADAATFSHAVTVDAAAGVLRLAADPPVLAGDGATSPGPTGRLSIGAVV